MKAIKVNSKCGPKEVLVDDDIFLKINGKSISLSRGYPVFWDKIKNNNIPLHRFVNKTPIGFQTDHINRNKLDCRRCNLRTCTAKENYRNRKFKSKLGYTGVIEHRNHKRYQARIILNGKFKHLGMFSTPIEAAKAYDFAAIKYYGEFASLNFPNP